MKSENKPYFSVPREVMDMSFFRDGVFTKGEALIDLYYLANWAEGEIEVRGILVPVNIGQVGWSFKRLAKRWGWSTSKVKLFLERLKSKSQIDMQNNNITTLITMKHYIMPKDIDPQNDTQKSRRRVAEESQKSPIYKNIKELKELKEIDTSEFPPALKSLYNIPGYNFDTLVDGKYLLELVNEFPMVDAVSLLTGWKAYILDRYKETGYYFRPNDKQRSQLLNQFKNAKKHNMHKKAPTPGNNGNTTPMSVAEQIAMGTHDYSNTE